MRPEWWHRRQPNRPTKEMACKVEWTGLRHLFSAAGGQHTDQHLELHHSDQPCAHRTHVQLEFSTCFFPRWRKYNPIAAGGVRSALLLCAPLRSSQSGRPTGAVVVRRLERPLDLHPADLGPQLRHRRRDLGVVELARLTGAARRGVSIRAVMLEDSLYLLHELLVDGSAAAHATAPVIRAIALEHSPCFVHGPSCTLSLPLQHRRGVSLWQNGSGSAREGGGVPRSEPGRRPSR